MNTPFWGAVCWVTVATSALAIPRITQQPSPAANFVSVGANLTNRIAATTTNPPLAFQWMLHGVALPDATNVTLILTNIQLSDAGSYVCTVTDLSGLTNSNPWAVGVDTQFTKVVSDPALSPGGCTGIAWGDYNNDGFIDLFVSPFNRTSLLFSNNGNGTFTRVARGSITTDSGATFGACWGDYDNDGWLDLFVGVNSQGNDWLYRNNGDGSFTKITNGAIVGSGGNANNCAWGDYDNDGFIDLFVANSDQNDFLFRNQGDRTFTRITTNAIALKTGNSQGGSWGDYDNDGLIDLFVSRVNEPNLLYHNLGGGAFLSVTNDPIARDVSAGQGTSWGDYDNDGFPDLFVANPLNGAKNFLYHNSGDGSFTKITNGTVVNDIGNSSSGAWGDYDNDGFLDLFVANRSGFDFFYHNNGDGTFTRVTNSVLARDPAVSFSAAWGDYDNDGFLDLFVTRFQTYNSALYHNAGNSNAWIILKCEGRLSNRAAIGAKVRVKAAIGSREVWQLREISGGGGLGAQPDLRPHFGLGDATNVDVVRIEWPSGIVQELHDVAPRQFLTVIEPEARITPLAQEVQAGSIATFTVTSTLAPPVEFQWRFNGTALPNETNALLVISNVQIPQLGRYTVTVNQPDTGLAFDTRPATLTGAIIASTNGQTLLVRPGTNLTLQVTATGAPPLAFQWWRDQVPLADATNTVLALTNEQLPDEGHYTVIVSNSFGSVTRDEGSIIVLIKPVITLQPLSQSVPAGGNVTFSVSASGHPLPLTFRWRKNGQTLASFVLDGTNSFFTVTNAQPTATTNQFNYSVLVTNLAGLSSISANAVLTVLADSDGDGLPNEWELAHGLDPNNPADALLDADGDGASNLAEYLAGTNPQDATSMLRVESVSCDATPAWRVRFLAASNHTYTLQARETFDEGSNWRNVAEVVAMPADRPVEIFQPAGNFTRQQFFRLLTPRSP